MPQSENSFFSGVTQGVVGSFIFTVLTFVAVTLLSRFVENWRAPILWGLLAASLASLTALLLMAAIRVNRRAATSTKNVEARVLAWLTKFSFTMKKDTTSDFHFRFIVTTTSGRKVTVVRSKDEYAEYLSILGYVALSDDEVKLVGRLTPQQNNELLASVKIELSHARMGYAGLESVTKFMMFKRVPIGPDLNVDRFIEAVNEMESVLNAVFQIGIIAVVRAGLIPEEVKEQAGVSR